MSCAARPIQVGDRIRDNDVRMGDRILTVTFVTLNGVQCESANGKRSNHLMKFIHTDGKPRKTGFSLIQTT